MLIDWFTVGAQVLNFLILMVLLKLFLYDRVIEIMDQRQEKISSRLDEAEQSRRQAEARREEVAAKEKELEAKRDELLGDAREKARAQQERWEQEARAEVDELRQRWREALDSEKESFARRLSRRTVRQAMTAAEQVVSEMAGRDFEERLMETFVERLRGLDEERRAALAENLDADHPAAVVRSRAEVPTTLRQKITRLLHEAIHPQLEVAYRSEEDFPGGIELVLPGQKISWSPRRYLEELEQALLEALEEMPRQAGQAEPHSGSGADGEPHGESRPEGEKSQAEPQQEASD
ncbi:MAG: hypothetical protein WBG37_18775 [Desulfobacterales bacterium]